MKTTVIPFVRNLGAVEEKDLDQEQEVLELRMARIRQFRSLSPSQKINYMLAGKAQPKEDVLGAIRDLTEILGALPRQASEY